MASVLDDATPRFIPLPLLKCHSYSLQGQAFELQIAHASKADLNIINGSGQTASTDIINLTEQTFGSDLKLYVEDVPAGRAVNFGTPAADSATVYVEGSGIDECVRLGESGGDRATLDLTLFANAANATVFNAVDCRADITARVSNADLLWDFSNSLNARAWAKGHIPSGNYSTWSNRSMSNEFNSLIFDSGETDDAPTALGDLRDDERVQDATDGSLYYKTDRSIYQRGATEVA